MRHIRLRPYHACLVALALCAAPAVGARADDPDRLAPAALVTLRSSDPCGFLRSEAFGRGLMHYSTEMLWACEAIADRRAAEMPLGDRLEACDRALARYRDAVTGAARQAFAERRRLGWNTGMPTLTDAIKDDLATRTGVLAALEAIRAGF